MHAGFFELTIILCASAILSILAKIFKQPTIIAYLLVGLLIGYFKIFDLSEQNTFRLFSDLGIMLLLFLVGLEINYTSLKLVGKVSAIIGIGQIIITSLIGFGLANFFGFDVVESAYISVALTFSSTIIIVKLLSDKKDLNSLYGKISIGFLLVQDLIAILMLVLLTSMEEGDSFSITSVSLALVKAIVLFLAMLWLGRKILPVVFDRIAYSQEVLFITSLAWVFAVAVLVNQIGFSIEIAGFLAGIALANSSEHFQIANRVRPLRDFFIVVFFVTLGSSFVFTDLISHIKPILFFSLFVLVGNPLIVLILMGVLGYRKRIGFLTGLTVAQISEFSLILIALGLKLGHINDDIVSMVTAVGIITIVCSTYLIMHGNLIYKYASGILSMFEKTHTHEVKLPKSIYNKPIVVIGFHRTGRSLVHNLPKKDVLIVDFDPESISSLETAGYSFILGDIADPEVFETSNCAKAKIVISTSPDMEDNLIIISKLQKLKKRPKIIVRSESEDEAKLMYNSGADYVILPHISSGQALGESLAHNNLNTILKKLKDKELSVIKSTENL